MKTNNILVVDDDDVIVVLMTELLSNLCETVSCARNGLEAISYVCKKDFSVIFMDIDMTNMNGLTTAKIIKMKNPTLKIIAHTSKKLSDIPDHEKYFDGYIRKGDLKILRSIHEYLA